MLRFITYALPLLILLLALFGFAVELLDAEPRPGSVIRLTLFEQPRVPAQLVLGAWLVEASGLLALFLLAQGRCGAWWLDGLVAGWLAWIFRGPLLVLTIVVAARQSHEPWWSLAFGWWILYSVCGLALAWLARRTLLAPPTDPRRSISELQLAPEDSTHAAIEPPLDSREIESTEANEGEPTEETPQPNEPAESEPEQSEPEKSEPEKSEPEKSESAATTGQDSDPSDDPTADGYETTVEESPTTSVANDEVDRDPADSSDRKDGRGDT